MQAYGTNKRSSWLVKGLKLEVYIPNLVRKREWGKKRLLWEEQIDFFRSDKWVFKRTSER